MQNPAGHPSSIELPALSSYSEQEWSEASSWPAIGRYRFLLSRTAEDEKDRLRLERHEIWLRCAMATRFDRATAADICFYWSKAAEKLILKAWRLSGLEATGYCLLALGKLGAEELNLSSDVDLIIVRPDGSAPDLKAFREFNQLLSDVTAFGFCLRADFTLRPGGRASGAIPTASEFEYHYGYHGEMWERLAYVRMRVLAGSGDLAKDIREFARKFSFRKHLDYTLIDELKSLRTKIRQEKFETRPGHFHLKLGEGGIRELELFVHALQVIHGGRIASLQLHSTTGALQEIRKLHLLPPAECDTLSGNYWYLRDLENRLHAHEDQQTYLINLQDGHPALPEGFAPKLAEVRDEVVAIATSLFGAESKSSDLPEDPEDQMAWLGEKGFSRESREETWPALLSATALSQKSERDEKARIAFLRGFVVKLSENRLDRDLGLSLLLDFVKAIRAKASFFTLLNRETRVRDELAMLFSISPYLGSILASRPELIDEFIFRKQAAPSSDMNVLLEDLAERRLLAELISANLFLTNRDLTKLTSNITDNADAICTTLLDRLNQDYGGSGLCLLPLGKWGGRELGLRSDLDFIFVTRAEPGEADNRIARRFLSRITEPHRGGAIYSVDMRLRPSGNAGPIMVSVDGLTRYLSEKAAAWERQAYLRSRVLGPNCLPADFRPARWAASRGLTSEDYNELRDIRNRLFKPQIAGELDLKLTYGGLADVEFTAQIALLARGEFSLDPSTSGMVQYLESLDAKWKTAGPVLREKYDALRRIEQLYQLTTSQSGSKVRVKSDEFARLALVLDRQPAELEADVRSLFSAITDALMDVGEP
jgi:[glutamine synthetase] adenylyltransferase / [glutamine synthetase]-adenylyl-L-tyrosine phosphorylase